jgi:hypothetical protein
MTVALIVCLAGIWLCRGLYLLRRVAGHELVRTERHGLLSWELWRRASLVAHSDGMGGHTLPRPRECRCLLLRVLGLPVWRDAQSIGLPAHLETTIHAVQAHEFDAAFASRFRCDKGGCTPTLRTSAS